MFDPAKPCFFLACWNPRIPASEKLELGEIDMGVAKNRGKPPKWMVKIMESPIKIHDLGVPLFLETPIYEHMIKFMQPACLELVFASSHIGYTVRFSLSIAATTCGTQLLNKDVDSTVVGWSIQKVHLLVDDLWLIMTDHDFLPSTQGVAPEKLKTQHDALEDLIASLSPAILQVSSMLKGLQRVSWKEEGHSLALVDWYLRYCFQNESI